MIQLLTRFDATSTDSADAFVHRLEAIRETIGEEPGQVSYRFFRARENATVIFAIEEWATQADADRHVAGATQGDEAKAALTLLATPPATFTIVAQ